MLTRLVMASPSQVMSTRAFSTALPLRIASAKPTYNSSSKPQGPARSNPLVGNYVPPEPTQTSKDQPPVKPEQISSKESKASIDIPPPPPPQASAPETITSAPQEKQHAYDALDSKPITIDIANILSQKSAEYARQHSVTNPMDKPKVRTKAVTGRTVFISDRLTPSSAPTPMVALRVLEKMCRDQKVKNKFHSQKFHERKGLKKKRLRSQRWRSRFKAGFKAAVSRVMELKKQGW
ncbi:ribosomal protein S21 [Pochonia chlamydosporia 170]|uniref:Ribosomal protein S21 n=1 Tax=Pochonia chlamydosporia 170 TaxID=1380566 RepID=A0A179FKH6_METCM|nr:ribosomal protein S21 [Pochonia chlamydosporia 170]OAQ65848.1 ribosomal protein S21 [Pochonia chlamydosporia 170]